MDALIKDLIRETTLTSGAVLTLTLVQDTKYGRFADAASVGQAVYYAIRNGDNSEVGIGTVQAGNTFDRTTPLVTVVGGVYDDTTPVKITLSGASTVALAPTAVALNDIIGDIAGASVINTLTQDLEYTATAGQTVFSGPDNNGVTLLLDTDASVMVFLNGVKLLPIVDYAVNAGAETVTLTVGAALNDVVNMTSFNYLASTGLTAANVSNASNLPARNSTLNKEAVTQGTSTRTGMSSTIYTGNGATQSVATGVDMATGDLGGLVWVKTRGTVNDNLLSDTVRGVNNFVKANDTAIEGSSVQALTTFDSTGFSVGSAVGFNGNTQTHVAWSFQTNQKFTGTTNRNKAYTAHYNTDLGFSIVGYVGDGVAGHEIPHHLGVEPELSIFKNRDAVKNWIVQGSPIGNAGAGDYLLLHTTGAIGNSTTLAQLTSDETIGLGTSSDTNTSSNNIISYHFASKAGVSKVGKYIGTGAAGNYVDCGFKVGWLMVKNLTGTGSWFLVDSIRGDGYLSSESSAAESTADLFDFVADGFVLKSTGVAVNAVNSEFIFLAFAETALDGTKQTTDYDYATTQDTLSIQQDTLISFANGFSASGQQDTQENVGAGVTYTLGVGHEDKHYWLYKDKAGSYGVSEYRPLEGLTRNVADTWGEVSPLDASLRTTAKHFGYQSSTGVALASGEFAGGFYAYNIFNKNTFDKWAIASITTSWVQYKLSEKRILKSWRIKAPDVNTQTPRLFTIEGSNDGFVWTAIDSSYTASSYVGNGANLWGALQDTSANTTAYLYHRINITANDGHATYTEIAELEFNTILPSDYYLVNDGVMYNNAGTAIERTYLAELMTNTDGEVSWYNNLPVAKQRFNSVDVHGDLLVKGEISNAGIATAWVNFDGTKSPPLMRDSFNVKDVVDIGTGRFKFIFSTAMDNLSYVILPSSNGGSTLGGNTIDLLNAPYNYATTLEFDVLFANKGVGNVDPLIASISVFGGKS
tara:strand:- start:25864 stop:28800 length:2937 start_codon:yes stop_codon:yes gene_type:complete